MIEKWKTVATRQISDLGLFRVNGRSAVSPRTGEEREFLVVDMPDWLQVVPLTGDGLLVMVEQYRHGNRLAGLEMPGGLLEPGDPDPGMASLRELREETGYGGGKLIELGSFWPQPALLSNRVHFFAAVGVELEGEATPDQGEDLEVVLVKPGQVRSLITQGRLHNAMSLTAWALAEGAGLF